LLSIKFIKSITQEESMDLMKRCPPRHIYLYARFICLAFGILAIPAIFWIDYAVDYPQEVKVITDTVINLFGSLTGIFLYLAYIRFGVKADSRRFVDLNYMALLFVIVATLFILPMDIMDIPLPMPILISAKIIESLLILLISIRLFAMRKIAKVVRVAATTGIIFGIASIITFSIPNRLIESIADPNIRIWVSIPLIFTSIITVIYTSVYYIVHFFLFGRLEEDY
jgi:hypothetical protein